MRMRRSGRASRRLIPVALLLAAVGLFVLPGRWTGGLISLVQVVVPFQDAVNTGVRAIDESFQTENRMMGAAQYETLQRENAALRHRSAALALRIAELEEEMKILSASRLWDVDGDRLGAKGQLIPARVLTTDLVAWRDSRLIGAGSLQGVRSGTAVTSHIFSIHRGQQDGIVQGMAVLLAEVLVGTVESAGTHTARIKMISDVTTQAKVRIGRFTRDRFVLVEHYYWLVGRGGGIMEIRGVDRRDVDAGRIAKGDVVLSDRMSTELPAPMTIGRVTAITQDRDNPLFSILTVSSPVDISTLQRVYVFVPEAEPGR